MSCNPRMPGRRPCAVCGAGFVPQWEAQAYCGPGCGRVASETRRLRRGIPLAEPGVLTAARWEPLARGFIAFLRSFAGELEQDQRRASLGLS